MTSRYSSDSYLFDSFCVLWLTLLLVQNGVGYKILTLAPMVTPSHKISMDPLLDELALRGHNVTVISPLRPTKTVLNLREILTFDLDTKFKIPNIFEMAERGEKVQTLTLIKAYSEICIEGLKSPAFQALKNESFDLVIIPMQVNECAGVYAMSTFKVPIILFSPVSAMPLVTTFYGNPSPPSFVPFITAGFSQRMSLFERIQNFVIEGIARATTYNVVYPSIEAKYREILNDSNLPSIEEMYKGTSLILSNSHFSISYKRPFLPNIVEVGGMHCHPAKELPDDLEKFIQTGDHGFILFSMGSALKSNEISLSRRESLIKTLTKLKERVIWKWDGEPIPNLPANVLLKKWLPQQDLLGHPKIKLFITHGGFGSTTEAVYHGVPLVGIPLFGDQEMNMKEMEHVGIGLMLNFVDLEEKSFLSKVTTVLNDQKYRTNVKKLSNIFRDQPDKPLDRAVYWTEYVIRHKGAPHLMSPGRDLNFIQYHSLDVVAILVAGIVAILLQICFLLKLCCRKIVSVFTKQSPTNLGIGDYRNKKKN